MDAKKLIPEEYDSKQADYLLRESLFNLKGNIDLLAFGLLDEMEAEEAQSFLSTLQSNINNLYETVNGGIIQKANRIKKLNNIIKKDLNMAQKIQQKIMPSEADMKGLTDFNIMVRYAPLAEVGGDIYNIHLINDNKLRIFLADATGHGVQAALTTMLIKSEYEKVKSNENTPDEIISSLNKVFASTYSSLTVFFTGIVVDIDKESCSIKYASAGHPSQYLILGDEVKELEKTGRIAGVNEQSIYNLREVKADFTAKLLLFTDGLFEQFNEKGEEFGSARLHSLIFELHRQSMDQMFSSLIGRVDSFIKDESYHDDMCVIAIECLK